MIYIYHNKETGEYYAFNNLKRLSEATGINYDTLKLWFTRNGETKVNRDNETIVKVELVKRKGSKK